MSSSGENPKGGGWWYRGRKPSNLQNETVRSQSTLYNIIFFRPLPRAPNCAAHDVKWTFRHGRTTSCTRILQYSRYILLYIIIMDLSDCVHKHIWSQRMCGRYKRHRAIYNFIRINAESNTWGTMYNFFFQIPYYHRSSSADHFLWIWYYFFLLTQIVI